MSGPLSPDTSLALLQASQQDSSKAAGKLGAAKDSRNLAKVDAAAKDFEAMFIAEMMKPMFSGIETSGPFGGGKGEEIFRGMMLQEYGKQMAQTGQIGVAEHVKQELLRIQEEAGYAGHE